MLKQLLFLAIAATVTPGTHDLYKGTTKLSTHPSEAACVAAAKARGVSANYTCRTRTGVLVSVTVDPPPVEPPPVVVPPPVVLPPPELPPAGNVVYASPPSASVALAAGQTLVLKDGVYTSFKVSPCPSWCVVKAEHDGAVMLPNIDLGAGTWNVQFEGLKFRGSGGSSVTGSDVTFKRTAFEGGPSSGNDVSLQIGTNDRTPGASNITLEDVWVYGLGGRYKVLVYNSTNVVLRRVIVRHDGGWTYDGRNPQGGFSIYDSSNVTAENIACVDSVQGLSGFESCIYLVSNGTTATKQVNVTINGAIIIDSPNNGLGAEGNGSAATYTVSNLLVVGSAQGGINTNNSAHVVNATRVTCSVKGVCFGKWASGGALRVNGCKVGSGTLSSGATLSACPGGTGAAFDDVLPWPNEARIKADFDSVRPAFGGKSFSDYVRGAL
jgi:hypothetical protein